MKARFWVTFEGDVDRNTDKVRSVKAVNLTQSAPANARGIPIEFSVDIPDELFLGRVYTIDVAVPPPNAANVPTAVPSTAWDKAKARHGVP